MNVSKTERDFSNLHMDMSSTIRVKVTDTAEHYRLGIWLRDIGGDQDRS